MFQLELRRKIKQTLSSRLPGQIGASLDLSVFVIAADVHTVVRGATFSNSIAPEAAIFTEVSSISMALTLLAVTSIAFMPFDLTNNSSSVFRNRKMIEADQMNDWRCSL